MAVSDIVSSAFDAAGPFEFRKDLTKAQASKLIDEMRKKAGVGDQVAMPSTPASSNEMVGPHSKKNE